MVEHKVSNNEFVLSIDFPCFSTLVPSWLKTLPIERRLSLVDVFTDLPTLLNCHCTSVRLFADCRAAFNCSFLRVADGARQANDPIAQLMDLLSHGVELLLGAEVCLLHLSHKVKAGHLSIEVLQFAKPP